MIDLTPALEQASDEKELLDMLGYIMFGEDWKELDNEHRQDTDN